MPPETQLHHAVYAFYIVCRKTNWDGTRTFLSEGHGSLVTVLEALEAQQYDGWDTVSIIPMLHTSGRRGLCVGGIRLPAHAEKKESS